MKKVFAVLLAGAMILVALASMVSCGEQNADPAKTGEKTIVAYVLAEKGDTYSLGLSKNFQTAFEALGGTVVMETFPTGTTNFSDYLQKAMDKNANLIFAPNSTTVASNLLKNANDLGVEMPILAGDTWESSVILDAVKGTDLEVYCSTFFDESDSSSTEAKAFVEGFKKYLNDNKEYYDMNGSNDIIAAVSALGFDAYNCAYAAIEAAAAEKGEDLTSRDVATALWALDVNGVTGQIKFDQNGDAIKDNAYVKKAKADGSAFEFVKVQSVENKAEQGVAATYDNAGVALDKVNKVITIGVYEPTSGANAAGGKQEVLGVQYANSLKPTIKIGENEYKIQLYVSDNGSLEENAVTAASKIVSENALVALGSYGSGVSIAASSTFEAAGIPAIGVSCTNAAVTENHDYYFRCCFLDPFQGSVMADFAYNLVK